MRSGLSCLIFIISFSVLAAESTIGWRGDGSGKFPDADPPLTWSRASKAIKGLHYQAKKSEGSDPAGKAMPDGVIREWLILGPVPIPDVPKPFEKDTIPGELQLAPDEGEKVENLVWKKVVLESSTVDFTALLGKNPKAFGYAATNIFSETGGAFSVSITNRSAIRLMLNGKQVYAGGGTGGARIGLPLLKGWNRLLMKVSPDEAQWWASAILYAHTPQGYDEANVAWMVSLPGVRVYQGTPASPGGPIVVNDKIFLLCEPHELFCLNKGDGKVLWVRSNSYFDALTDAEKSANPAFKEIEPLAAKWEESNAAFLSPDKKKTGIDRDKLEKALYDGMKKIDPKRFTRPNGQDVGYAGFTPVSDGKFVYVWLANGVTACYDLDGNRKWIRLDNHITVEHGFSSSPVLVGGKLIVFMRDLMAFDAKTGAEVWRDPIVGPTGDNPGGFFHGTATCTRIGDTDVVITPNGGFIRATDGKILYTDAQLEARQCVGSPVIEKGALCLLSPGSFFNCTLPTTAGEKLDAPKVAQLNLPTTQYPFYYLNWHISSPLVHDGLAYVMSNSGVLTVVDQKDCSLVYQKFLDLDHFESANEGAARGHGVSPVMAGKYIYFFGNCGATVVIQPGREFKQVARNKIEGLAAAGDWGERQDRTVANPFFEGKRLYYRTETGLYAIEQK